MNVIKQRLAKKRNALTGITEIPYIRIIFIWALEFFSRHWEIIHRQIPPLLVTLFEKDGVSKKKQGNTIQKFVLWMVVLAFSYLCRVTISFTTNINYKFNLKHL